VTPTPSPAHGWQLDHSYSLLPPLLHQRCDPTPVRSPQLIILNLPLAQQLGLDPAQLAQPENAGLFTGNPLPPGAHPIAQAYAGHQFGNFTGLGDGRALLLGEQITPSGQRCDIQLKGSGPTPFSRRGDGRAALGPMLREYLISEAMHALGIPTTRSLAVATTGETIYRQQPLPGAVLTRIASSHIRVGTFEWVAAHQENDALRALADHTLLRHYPHLSGTDQPYLSLLNEVIDRQAALIARWMSVGFVHGVMNTDNMALSGETIDYGPCAFIDSYDPATVFSSIDRHGRYAFGNQAHIAQWNLARFAETLLPLLHDEEAQAIDLANTAINGFTDRYQHRWLAVMGAKLGLTSPTAADTALIKSLLDWMQQTAADHTNTFRALSSEAAIASAPFAAAEFQLWHQSWTQRLAQQAQSPSETASLMRTTNPAVIPRNHLVEEALAAGSSGDLQTFGRYLDVLAQPFDDPKDLELTQPALPTSAPYRTFCGT
jgi:serine/tyrosine/threonine adenylyltransferase